jgi:hypothetical protein
MGQFWPDPGEASSPIMQSSDAVPQAAGRGFDRARFVRRLAVAGSLAVIGVQVVLFAVGWLADASRIPLGLDWLGYRAGFERFLATGSPYAAFELNGTFTPEHLDFIHPPNFLVLVGPFAILPQPLDFILWDAVPIAVFIYLLRRLAWWGWPLVAVLSTTNSLQYPILNGNSSLWMCAAFGLGIRVGWSAGLLAMKPTLLPLAIVGIRRPIPALLLAVVPIVLTIPLFPDYLTVLRNMEGIPLSYSLSNYSLIALAALPWCVEWVERRRASGGFSLGRTTRRPGYGDARSS